MYRLNSGGRTRLPTWVVRMRSWLVGMMCEPPRQSDDNCLVVVALGDGLSSGFCLLNEETGEAFADRAGTLGGPAPESLARFHPELSVAHLLPQKCMRT